MKPTQETYRAWVVREGNHGAFETALEDRPFSALPAGDVLIRVLFASLNYKDVLSTQGNRGVTRHYPHTPGVDGLGIVVTSTESRFPVGSTVMVTGYDLGMNTHGALGEYIRVPAAWVLPLPRGLSPRQAMAIGTAGFTAALSLRALRAGQATPDQGNLLVTGASGGVGSMAVFLAARAGFRVCAVTGKSDTHDMLSAIGATDILSRDDALAARARPLAKVRWAHAIDTVGGDMLDAALRATARGGVVTTCGMVASPELNTNVYPFILRGVRLQGIDAAETDMEVRREVWSALGNIWTDAAWAQIVREVALDEVMHEIGKMADGKSRGRVLVRVADPAIDLKFGSSVR